jgi:glycosyltransferase involved in cell wall biosynthesis
MSLKKIAVCIDSYNIDYSPSIINLLDCLSDRFEIDLFLRNVFLSKSHVLARESIHIYRVRKDFSISYFWKSGKQKLKEIIKMLLLKKNAGPGKRAGNGGVSVKKTRKQVERFDYYRHICMDPHGFLLCKELFPGSRPIYYSLELYLKDDYLDTYYPPRLMRELNRLMDRERTMSDDIGALIIQSKEKEELFKKDYGLPEDLPVFILPVTYTGAAVNGKSNYLREMYGIAEDRRIAIHLGGMNDWFSCIEIAEVFSRMPGWVLFFQGNHSNDYLKRFDRVICGEKAKNIIVSRTFYDQLDSLDRVMMSADLGIAWYNNISKNFTHTGRSSGKIAAYMRFGLPTIAKNYPSMVDAIEDTGCGLCVDEYDEIEEAVKKIEGNFKFFSENAFREYEKTYWFEKYRERLLEFIKSFGGCRDPFSKGS